MFALVHAGLVSHLIDMGSGFRPSYFALSLLYIYTILLFIITLQIDVQRNAAALEDYVIIFAISGQNGCIHG